MRYWLFGYTDCKAVALLLASTQRKTLRRAGVGITIGPYINGNNTLEANPNNSLFQHEYGHYLQSQAMGWGYLSRAAIPSLMDAWHHNDGNHDFQPYEQDANRRAFMYFNKNVKGFYKSYEDRNKPYGWDFYDNPLDVNHVGFTSRFSYYDYQNQADRDLVNSLSLHTQWYDYLDPLGLFVGIGNGIYYNNHRVK